MKMKKLTILVLISLLLLFLGCIYSSKVPKKVQNAFQYRIDGNNTNIKSLINTNGYWLIIDTTDCFFGFDNRKLDSTFTKLIFYEDGTILYSVSINETGKNEKVYWKGTYGMTLAGQSIIAGYGYSGYYRICDDTIKTCLINHTNIKSYWIILEKWYEVIDRNTLKLIYYNDPINEIIIYEFPNILPIRFKPKEDLPHINIWLKNQDWLKSGKNMPECNE